MNCKATASVDDYGRPLAGAAFIFLIPMIRLPKKLQKKQSYRLWVFKKPDSDDNPPAVGFINPMTGVGIFSQMSRNEITGSKESHVFFKLPAKETNTTTLLNETQNLWRLVKKTIREHPTGEALEEARWRHGMEQVPDLLAAQFRKWKEQRPRKEAIRSFGLRLKSIVNSAIEKQVAEMFPLGKIRPPKPPYRKDLPRVIKFAQIEYKRVRKPWWGMSHAATCREIAIRVRNDLSYSITAKRLEKVLAPLNQKGS